MKVAFQDIQLPAQSQNSPTKLVVWSFSAQSTAPLLIISFYATSTENILVHMVSRKLQYSLFTKLPYSREF